MIAFAERLMQPVCPPGSDPLVALAWLWGAAVVTGIAKSGFGGGIGILAVPMVAIALRPDIAIGVMLPALIAADAVAVWQHRKNRSPEHLKPALTGAVIGIALASIGLLVMLGLGSDGQAMIKQTLGGTVGILCLTMVALQAYRALGGKTPRLPQTARAARWVGGTAGFASTLSHAAGPIMAIYWLQSSLPKPRLIGTLVVFFLIVNAVKTIPYVFPLGLINPHTLGASLLMLPAIPVGALAGWWMQDRIPEKPFMWVMYLGVLVGGGRLVAQAFA